MHWGKRIVVDILLADEMDLVTQGARFVLRDFPAWTVVGEYHTLTDTVNHLASEAVDVIVCGEQIEPLYDPFSLLKRLQLGAPNARLILIGCSMDGKLIHELLDYGLHGYLFHGDALRNCLPTAVSTTISEALYLSPTANSAYLVAMQSFDRHYLLDDEARTVLRLLARGYTVGSIAAQMKVAPRRIYWIRLKLRRRFGASTNEHLISCAAAEGYMNSLE